MLDSQTLKGKSLSLDILAALAIGFIIFIVGINLYSGFKDRYIGVNVTDANNVNVFIDSELANAQNKLELFSMLSPPDRQRMRQSRFQSFSDLYALDPKGSIIEIYKSAPESQIFEGYQFQAGPVRDQLLNGLESVAVSSLVQGHEDGLPSVYMMYRGPHQTIIGRLNLDYIGGFISQYSQITGNVLLITTEQGVVMVSGRPNIAIPRIDPQLWGSNSRPGAEIRIDNQGWVPVVTDSPVLGAKLVVLISTRLLEQQRIALSAGLAVILAALALAIALKNHKLNQDVLQPIVTFIRRMRSMEAGQPRSDRLALSANLPAEFIEIDRGFEAMTQAIVSRESALHNTAEELRQREYELSLILQHVPIPLIVFKSQGQFDIRFINNAFIEVFGYDLQATPSISDLFRHSCQDSNTATAVYEQVSDMVRSHRDAGKPSPPVEVEIACRSGVKHDVIIAAISLGETAIATFVDVTPLRTSQRELLQAKFYAEEQQKQKAEFLAIMSHEIRTPLTSILGITQLLSAHSSDHRQKDLTARLTDTGKLLLRIINDVLDHSKIEAGELRIDPTPFEPQALIQKCSRMFSDLAADKGIELITEAAPDCATHLNGDAFRIEQVLSNLVGNAIKFTDQGRVGIKLRCQAHDDQHQTIHLEVSDTGIGIDESSHDEIFSPFKQSDQDTAQRYGGTGLGLSISKRLVQLMGGEIGFKSAPGQGSVFWFKLTLPIVQATRITESEPSIRFSEQRQFLLRDKRILIVEDSQALVFLLQEMLEPLQMQVFTASNGEQAIEVLKQQNLAMDLVLMDIQMPVMDGVQCTQMIRQTLGLTELPIIAMTAALMDQQKDAVITAGASTILTKPLQTDVLLSTLADLLEGAIRAKFPKIAGIDLPHTMQTMGHRPEFFERLLRIFLEENKDIALMTVGYIQQGRREEAAKLMHRLRGSANQLGALRVGELAHRIEMGLQEQASDLIAELEELRGALLDIQVSAEENSHAD